MLLFPAIDLYGGKAVRLYKGSYDNMTVYNDRPLTVAEDFCSCGATHIHMVDLEGARDGGTPNLSVVSEIAEKTGAFIEIGGGIRSKEVVETYLSAGVSRVILGTAAITDRAFLENAVAAYGDKIAVGADVRDGKIAIKGWLETADVTLSSFLADMQVLGVDNVICTDISKDGAMQGTNRELYRHLSREYTLKLTASGGVSSLEDVRALADMGLYGVIIGKAYYTGAIDLRKALEVTA